MIKTQIQKIQVNLKNTADKAPCPYKMLKLVPVIACKCGCERFAGIDGEFVKCGNVGANKDMLKVNDGMRKPSLWEILRKDGHDDRGSLVRGA
jgi:hypothetical protein